ncbi:MAG: ribonuclease Z [Nanoarchaeota archaeon]
MAEKIKIVFLGTGQAVPTSSRNHSGILLTYKDENILIDCGEGIQRQFRIAKINPCNLTRILITHWHGDHILGIPGLLQTLALNSYRKKLQIVIPHHTTHFLDKMLSMFITEGKLNMEIKEAENEIITETKDFIINTLSMAHSTRCNAYSFTEKEKINLDKGKLKKLGLLNNPLCKALKEGKDIEFKGKKIKAASVSYKETGKKIAFILDTSPNPNIEKLAKNSDLLIIESTYANEEETRAKEYLHLTTKMAAEEAKKSKVKKLILTHISQRYEHKAPALLKEAKKLFKNTIIAEDFLALEV